MKTHDNLRLNALTPPFSGPNRPFLPQTNPDYFLLASIGINFKISFKFSFVSTFQLLNIENISKLSVKGDD
jgi:hypothetical protein